MVNFTARPGTPGTFNLSIPCSNAHDALATAAGLVALARDALSLPNAAERAQILLDLALQGISAALPILKQTASSRQGGEIENDTMSFSISHPQQAASGAEGGEFELDRCLVRIDLTELDRGVYLAQRKLAYEALHPETKQGGYRKPYIDGKPSTGAPSFVAYAAERIGLTERAIRRLTQIGSSLSAEICDRITGTWLADHQSQLMALARAPAERHAAILDLLLLDEASGVKTVAAALRRLTGGEG